MKIHQTTSSLSPTQPFQRLKRVILNNEQPLLFLRCRCPSFGPSRRSRPPPEAGTFSALASNRSTPTRHPRCRYKYFFFDPLSVEGFSLPRLVCSSRADWLPIEYEFFVRSCFIMICAWRRECRHFHVVRASFHRSCTCRWIFLAIN